MTEKPNNHQKQLWRTIGGENFQSMISSIQQSFKALVSSPLFEWKDLLRGAQITRWLSVLIFATALSVFMALLSKTTQRSSEIAEQAHAFLQMEERRGDQPESTISSILTQRIITKLNKPIRNTSIKNNSQKHILRKLIAPEVSSKKIRQLADYIGNIDAQTNRKDKLRHCLGKNPGLCRYYNNKSLVKNVFKIDHAFAYIPKSELINRIQNPKLIQDLVNKEIQNQWQIGMRLIEYFLQKNNSTYVLKYNKSLSSRKCKITTDLNVEILKNGKKLNLSNFKKLNYNTNYTLVINTHRIKKFIDFSCNKELNEITIKRTKSIVNRFFTGDNHQIGSLYFISKDGIFTYVDKYSESSKSINDIVMPTKSFIKNKIGAKFENDTDSEKISNLIYSTTLAGFSKKNRAEIYDEAKAELGMIFANHAKKITIFCNEKKDDYKCKEDYKREIKVIFNAIKNDLKELYTNIEKKHQQTPQMLKMKCAASPCRTGPVYPLFVESNPKTRWESRFFYKNAMANGQRTEQTPLYLDAGGLGLIHTHCETVKQPGQDADIVPIGVVCADIQIDLDQYVAQGILPAESNKDSLPQSSQKSLYIMHHFLVSDSNTECVNRKLASLNDGILNDREHQTLCAWLENASRGWLSLDNRKVVLMIQRKEKNRHFLLIDTNDPSPDYKWTVLCSILFGFSFVLLIFSARLMTRHNEKIVRGSLLRNLPLGLIELDEHQNIVQANDYAEDLLGLNLPRFGATTSIKSTYNAGAIFESNCHDMNEYEKLTNQSLSWKQIENMRKLGIKSIYLATLKKEALHNQNMSKELVVRGAAFITPLREGNSPRSTFGTLREYSSEAQDEIQKKNEAQDEIQKKNEAQDEIQKKNEAQDEIQEKNEAQDIVFPTYTIDHDAGSIDETMKTFDEILNLYYSIGYEYSSKISHETLISLRQSIKNLNKPTDRIAFERNFNEKHEKIDSHFSNINSVYKHILLTNLLYEYLDHQKIKRARLIYNLTDKMGYLIVKISDFLLSNKFRYVSCITILFGFSFAVFEPDQLKTKLLVPIGIIVVGHIGWYFGRNSQ